jgi:hypothetical protein
VLMLCIMGLALWIEVKRVCGNGAHVLVLPSINSAPWRRSQLPE